MKKLLLLTFLALFLSNVSEAQGTANLAFSRVLLITSLDIVPTGYIWKIENILPSTRLSSAAAIVTTSQSIQSETYSTEQIIKINNNNIYY